MDTAHEVRDNTNRSRYEILAGDSVIGVVDYNGDWQTRELTHTEVEDSAKGTGAAQELVRGALESARGQGLSILPTCPFVRDWMADHTQYSNLVPAGERERFGL